MYGIKKQIIFIISNNQNNAKSVAKLTNKANWTKYLDKDNKASWAIGTPTLDMFIKSYNETHEENKLSYTTGDDGYIPTGTIEVQDNHSIYAGVNSSATLLASPRANPAVGVLDDGSMLCFVNNNTKGFSAIDYEGGKSIRPIVAIPKGNFTFTIKDE